MFIANFLGGPTSRLYKQPINVKISFMEYLCYYVMGSKIFLDRLSERMDYDYHNDYFSGVQFYGRLGKS